MITCYFGLPGSGKSTLLACIAQKEIKKIRKGKSRYEHVYTNFPCRNCEQISVSDLSKFKVSNSLILLDEITLDVDSRDYKTFSQGLKEFFILHRHIHSDCIYFTQQFDRVDKTIRDLTMDLWYLKKSIVPIFSGFSVAKRIFRNININEYTSELTVGYRFAKFLEILFTKSKRVLWRRPYYKYFDSFHELQLSSREELHSEVWNFEN